LADLGGESPIELIRSFSSTFPPNEGNGEIGALANLKSFPLITR
jgi:hypothetical protein